MNKLMTLAMAVLTLALLGAVRPAAVAQDSRDPIRDMVGRLELGKPVSHGSLTIIPVYLDQVKDRTGYVSLEDALKNGSISITEVEGGRVPQVKISNLSKHMIFLMGGEILTGGGDGWPDAASRNALATTASPADGRAAGFATVFAGGAFAAACGTGGGPASGGSPAGCVGGNADGACVAEGGPMDPVLDTACGIAAVGAGAGARAGRDMGRLTSYQT